MGDTVCPVCGRRFRSRLHIIRVAKSLESLGYISRVNSMCSLYVSPLLPDRTFTSLFNALTALAEAGIIGPEVCYPRARKLENLPMEEKLRLLLSKERGREARIALKHLVGRRKVMYNSFYTREYLMKVLPQKLEEWRLIGVERSNGGWQAIYRRGSRNN